MINGKLPLGSSCKIGDNCMSGNCETATKNDGGDEDGFDPNASLMCIPQWVFVVLHIFGQEDDP